MSMTDILLTVSVGCNLWFLFLLLYERIMDTQLVRFFRASPDYGGHWTGTRLKSVAAQEEVPTAKADIIGKSRFKMASTRTTAAIPTQQAATSEKGIELSEEEATFDDGNTETTSRPAQVPEEKLDETFTSIPPEELGYGENEPEEDASTRHGLRAAALTKSTTPARPPRTRTRRRRNGKGGKGIHRHGRHGAV